jgi:uncharacterized protein (TIGR02996 family)
MSDEKALLAAIWDDPYDDTVRLVYADWLDENGQPERAEFIRVQIELARLDEWADPPPALLQRQQELWKKWRIRWRAHLPKKQRSCDFHRGFPLFVLSSPPIPIRKLLELTVADLEHAPLACYNDVFRGHVFHEMLQWPGLRFLQQYAPFPPLPKGWVKQVAACDNFRNVSELDLRSCILQPAEFRALLDAWADRHLLKLFLPRKCSDVTMAALASHPTAARVRTLIVSKGSVTKAGVRSMCSSRHLTQVRALSLQSNRIGDAGVDELLRWRHLRGLRYLDLIDTKLTDAGAAALAECPALTELRGLKLASNAIDVDGSLALARSPHLDQRLDLWLGGTPGGRKLAVRKALRARFGEGVDW